MPAVTFFRSTPLFRPAGPAGCAPIPAAGTGVPMIRLHQTLVVLDPFVKVTPGVLCRDHRIIVFPVPETQRIEHHKQ
jgi:hypothetical protein